MKKQSFIRDYCQVEHDFMYFTFISAMTACYSSAEACDALEESFRQDRKKLSHLVKRISKDMAIEWLPCHGKVVDRILSQLHSLSFREQLPRAKMLREVAHALPSKCRRRVMKSLMASKYIPIRHQCTMFLRSNWDKTLASCLRACWCKYRDFDVASLLVAHDDAGWLYKNRIMLKCDCGISGLLARLYIRLSTIDKDVIEEIRHIDTITFAYVLAFTGRRVSSSLAKCMVQETLHDERFGLLVWSLGQMKHWVIVSDLATQSRQIWIERLRRSYPNIELDEFGHAMPVNRVHDADAHS